MQELDKVRVKGGVGWGKGVLGKGGQPGVLSWEKAFLTETDSLG